MVPPLISLALEYYRNPLAYSHLADVSSPLPRTFPDMLAEFGAGLSSATIGQTARMLDTDARELEEAARFFVRHALLDPAGDYYRCLGLSRDASEATIRKHYRLLIRLFHPDRLAQSDDADLAYSSRLNAAYHVLQDPDERARYDQGLPKRSGRRAHGDPAAFLSPRPTAVRLADSGHRRGLLALDGRSMALGAMVSIALVGGVFLLVRTPDESTLRVSRPLPAADLRPLPSYLEGATRTSGADPTPVAEHATAHGAKSAERSPDLGTVIPPEIRAAEREITADAPEPTEGAEKQPPSAGVVKTPSGPSFDAWLSEILEKDKSSARPRQTADRQPAPAAPPRVDFEPASPPVAAPSAERSRPAPTASSESRPTTAPSASAAVIGERMIGGLERAYRQGNAGAFAALFTGDARTSDGGGRPLIRKQYARLFRESRSQQLSFEKMRWRPGTNGGVRGSGTVSVAVQDAASGAWRRSSGPISLELVSTDAGYRISAMHYDTN